MVHKQQIDMNSVVYNVLQQLGICSYLNNKTIFNLSSVSSSLFLITQSHLAQHFTFTLNRPRKLVEYNSNSVKRVYWVQPFVFLEKNTSEIFETSLPTQLTHLSFNSEFNLPVDNCLPSSLTHLIFGQSFNQKVDNLPPLLSRLNFGIAFNKNIGYLPSKLVYLSFITCKEITQSSFNKYVDNLPRTLKYLYCLTSSS